jgi:hypothetical protein
MIAVLIIGIVIDKVLFGRMENGIRQRWGLIDPAAEAQPSRLQSGDARLCNPPTYP